MWPCTVGHKVRKAPQVAKRRGTVLLLRQHLCLWHKAGATCTEMTPFGHKNRFCGPSMSDLQHLSFVVGCVGVLAGADGRWSPAHLLTFPRCRRLPSGTFACISIRLTCYSFCIVSNMTFFFCSFLPTNVWIFAQMTILLKLKWAF